MAHGTWNVRDAALSALSEVAARGDHGALAAVAARLEDAESRVRRTAVHALGQIAERGDAAAAAALFARLEDTHPAVREGALQGKKRF